MTIATKEVIDWKKFSHRFTQVTLSAVLITLVTYIAFPNYWIYFGVLHFFSLSMLVLLPFRNSPRLSLVLGASIFILFNTTDWFNLSPLYNWLKPLLGLPTGTQDLTRFIPWFGMILFGSSLAHYGTHLFRDLGQKPWLRSGWFIKICLFMGRNPLKIYLLHQPLLFGLIYVVSLLI